MARSRSRWMARGVLLALIVSAMLVSLFAPGGRAVSAASPSYPIDTSDSKWGYVTEWAGDGQLYALYNSVTDTTLTMRLAQSPADGTSWSTKFTLPVSVAGEKPNYPRIASDRAGVMHMVWSDDKGNGSIRHGMFVPGAGKSPSNYNDWSFEVIAWSGKNASMSLRASDGVMVVTWDDNGLAWGRTYNGGWRNPVELTGASGSSCDNPCLLAPALTPDGSVHVLHVDAGRSVAYNRFNLDWQSLEGTTWLSSAQANHWPQIVADGNNNVHAVWSQRSGPNDSWEVYYSMRTPGGQWNPNTGRIERVSRNLNGTVHQFPTIALDGAGLVHVSWNGDDASPRQFRVYERVRGADSNPWPDYTDETRYRVYCTSGDGQHPIYGFSLTGRVHLGYVLDASGNRAWGTYYSDRTGDQTGSCGPVQPGPGPAPGPITTYPSGPGFTDWSSLGGVLTDSPAAATLNGVAYVFVKGADNALYMQSKSDNGSWSGWVNLGGVLSASPAAATANGQLSVFVKGADNALYMMSTRDGVAWSAWVNLGGVLTASPAAAGVGNRLYIFAKGADDALYVRSTTDGMYYTPWASQGGVLTAAPAAAGLNGNVVVLAKGADNALYEKHSADGANFTDWSYLGGVLTAAPAAANTDPNGNGTLYILAKGADNALYARTTTDVVSFTDWAYYGGRLAGPPTATGTFGLFYIFVRWENNELWETHR